MRESGTEKTGTHVEERNLLRFTLLNSTVEREFYSIQGDTPLARRKVGESGDQDTAPGLLSPWDLQHAPGVAMSRLWTRLVVLEYVDKFFLFFQCATF